MSLTPVTPLKAQSLGGEGARLVDIRSPHEFAASNVPGAENRPLSSIEPFDDDRDVVFLCRTGRRTELSSAELAALTRGKAYRLEGGIEGWRDAGLPLALDRQAGSLDLDQQALIASGALVILASLFAVIVSGWYFLVSVLVAADLIRTGRTGKSVIARLLAKLPWNARKG